MTKVMIVGDTHGDVAFLYNIMNSARTNEVDTIVQLGDFGYEFAQMFLHLITKWLDEKDHREFFWLDGNHDQHEYIEQDILKGGGVSSTMPVSHFHDRMYYCPRGSVATIGSRTCLFMGGAYSIDVSRRTPYVSWWPQEMIRYSDIDNALQNATNAGEVHVVFSHDCPNHAMISDWLHEHNYKIDDNSRQNREALSLLVDRVRPQTLYHGHYHCRYTQRDRTDSGWQYVIEGVGANIAEDGWSVSPAATLEGNYLIREW